MTMSSSNEKKEGGWGYVVTFCAFVIHVIVCGVTYSAGVFHLALMDTFKENQLMTSLITSPLMGLIALSGVFATWIMYCVGFRFTVIIGGIMAGLGFGLSLLVEEYYQTIIAAAGIGFGFGITLKASLAAVSAYFYSKHGTMINTVSVGATVGGMLFPVGLYFIHAEWDWQGTCMSMVIACAVIVLCGALLEPNGPSLKTHRHFLRMFECSLLRCLGFWAILLANFFWSLGVSMIYVHFPNFMNDSITTKEDSVILVSGIGAANFASRVMFVMFSVNEHFDHVTTALCTIGLTSIITGLFKELFKTYAGKIGYVIIFGFHSGFWTTFVSNLGEDVIGKPYIGYGRGYIVLSIGLGLAGGGPLGGWLKDDQGDYEATFYAAGAGLLLASVILMASSLRKCYYIPWGHGTPAGSVNGDDKNNTETGAVSTLLSSV